MVDSSQKTIDVYLVEKKTRNEINNSDDFVRHILSNDEMARDNSLYLLLEVWKLQGVDLTEHFTELRSCFSPETVTRIKRKIQNTEGKLKPSLLREKINGIRENVFMQEMVK